MLKIFQISINKNVIRDVQPSNHSITSKELQQMYLSENDYIGKCSCIVCREIKSKKGIHSHYLISHTELGKAAHIDICEAMKISSRKKYENTPKKCIECHTLISYENRRANYCSKECRNALSKESGGKSNCVYCGCLMKTKSSSIQHEIRCKKNPDRYVIPSRGMLGKKGSNQHIKAKQLGTTVDVSESTRKKISDANIKRGKLPQKTKDKIRDSMNKAVEKYPESYSTGNSHHAKRYYHNGVMCQGTWELDFYKWCLVQNINVVRCTVSFPYNWNGTTRKYFPDFYLPDLDVWIEVKGFETERDHAKWKSFPHCLLVIRKNQIEAIRSGNFLLVDLLGYDPRTSSVMSGVL